MFGGTIAPLGTAPPPRPFPKTRDYRGCKPGEYGVLERRAGSDWPSRAMQYEQRKSEMQRRGIDGAQENVRLANYRHKWEIGCDHRDLVTSVKRKVSAAMRCYDENLAERRERLRVLLLNEEAALERELVDKAQRMDDNKFVEMKQRAEQLKQKREAEMRKIVEEKRLQQYRERCEDLRPMVAKRNLLESKQAQLMQIKDKECQQEEERLRDKMWYEITMKDVAAKIAREEYDVQERFSKDREDLKTFSVQLGALEEMKKQKAQLREEERKEQERIREELRQEEMQRLKDTEDKRDAMARELKEQIAVREAFLAERKRQEDAIDQTFVRLAAAELRKEQEGILDNTQRLKREVAMYRENLAELKKERALEDAHLQKLVDDVQKEVNARRDANRRTIREARQKLLDETIEGRRQQIEDQNRKALEEANQKLMEKEISDRLMDTHVKLQEGHERNKKVLMEQYRLDLIDQIAYSNELKRREQEELDREFLAGMMEEERYLRLMKELIAMPLLTEPHPFMTAMTGGAAAGRQGRSEDTVRACLCSPTSLI